MADSKDPKDPKANQANTGAVKPPVLDLKARTPATIPGKPDTGPSESGPAAAKPAPDKPATAGSGDTAASSAATGAGAASAAKSDTNSGSTSDSKPASSARPGDTGRSGKPPEAKPAAAGGGGLGVGIGAALLGGLLGLGAAYGLAYSGYWPEQPAPVVTPDPRLAAFERSIAELETVTGTTQSELARLTQRVAALEQAEPAAPAAQDDIAASDIAALQERIAALAERLDALETAPAEEAAPQIDSGAIEALRGDLSAMSTRLDEVAGRVGSIEANLRQLDNSVADNSAALASQPGDIGAVLQLPLILSGLETAFATGRPYEAELATLRAATPDAEIPTLIANNAAQGLVRPDRVVREFDAVLPAILAGRPSDPNAQWQDGALDWLAGVIALRPTGEIEGDTPQAITSRLIGAVERRDFVEAQLLLESLPLPMQLAAGPVAAMIAEQAVGEVFLQALRASALNGEVVQ